MYDLIAYVDSHPRSELVASIPISTWSPYIFNSVYCVPVDNLKLKDLLVCFANCEVTSEHGYNVMIAGYLVLSKFPLELKGKYISQPAGGNMVPGEHHRAINFHGSVIVDDDEYQYVSLILYSASTAAKPNDKIIVENDYGRLYVFAYRLKYLL